jgi:hypothetical protein
MTATKPTPNLRTTYAIDNTQELRDALFHAICLLDHAHPDNDTDRRDIAAARELARLRDSLNERAYEQGEDVLSDRVTKGELAG